MRLLPAMVFLGSVCVCRLCVRGVCSRALACHARRATVLLLCDVRAHNSVARRVFVRVRRTPIDCQGSIELVPPPLHSVTEVLREAGPGDCIFVWQFAASTIAEEVPGVSVQWVCLPCPMALVLDREFARRAKTIARLDAEVQKARDFWGDATTDAQKNRRSAAVTKALPKRARFITNNVTIMCFKKETGIEVTARWYHKNTHVAEGMRCLRPGVEIRPRGNIVALRVGMEAPTASFKAKRFRRLRCMKFARGDQCQSPGATLPMGSESVALHDLLAVYNESDSEHDAEETRAAPSVGTSTLEPPPRSQ